MIKYIINNDLILPIFDNSIYIDPSILGYSPLVKKNELPWIILELSSSIEQSTRLCTFIESYNILSYNNLLLTDTIFNACNENPFILLSDVNRFIKLCEILRKDSLFDYLIEPVLLPRSFIGLSAIDTHILLIVKSL
jgi:hypothetical protein